MTAIRLLQLNDVKLSGRVTRDPELKFTAKGQAVCRFDLALNRRYKDANGEWKDDEPTFVSVVAWREAAQRCADRLKKGSPVYVDGYLKSRAWETKEGQKRTSLEVIAQRIQFLAKMEGEKDSSDSAEAAAEPAVAAVGAGASSDEDIPF
mgnify:CR=1 FL=1